MEYIERKERAGEIVVIRPSHRCDAGMIEHDPALLQMTYDDGVRQCEQALDKIKKYDYPFSTPTKNAVNKRIIERCIFFPRLWRGKIYAKNLKFCIAAVFVVCQRDNHIKKYLSET